MKRDGIRLDAQGYPMLTRRQVAQVHGYARDLVLTGTSKRRVTPYQLAAALFELALHASAVQSRLEQFMVGAARAVPAREVARVAVALLVKLKSLPDDSARERFMAMLLGDDDDATPDDVRTH